MKWILLIALVFSPVLLADDDVQKLIDDARAILVAHRETTASPQEYAKCIFALEKAQALVENAGDSSAARAQEVNTLLFWARRFSNVEILREVEKLRTANGGSARIAGAAKPAFKAPEKGALPEARQLADAKSAYDAAAAFAAGKPRDPYTVSLRWFQMASQFAGTDYALKALERAREAQAQVATLQPGKMSLVQTQRAQAESEELRQDKAEYALIRDGMALEANDLEGAIGKYKAAISMRDTIPAERHLGHAYVRLAQKIAEEVTPKFAELDVEYNAAFNAAYVLRGGNRFFDDRDPGWVAAQQKLKELRKEADAIIVSSANAQVAFEKVLKLTKDGKDFDAAAYVGVSMSKRASSRFRGRAVIKEFLDRYKPSSGEEQMTYEFCRAEFERLGH